MRACRKCGSALGNRVTIDGKVRNLQRRLYCLDCSPYGAHNTKKIEASPVAKSYPDIQVTCKLCNREYVYNVARTKGSTLLRCNSCKTNHRRFELKIRCIAYKGGKCETCGYDKCSRALIFHHKDPAQKDWNIGGNHCRKWETIKQELDKCSLLCANCHAEAHANEDSKRRDPSRNG